ncbi:MAG: hypothetical protein P4L16_08295 [Chlamydiales bacterium]|nr:hypothetical protein [Chlamydiales bacterium]
MFKIAVICGGPSAERGISLNSARSILDHLSSKDVKIVPLYVDWKEQFYVLTEAQLYSNTPADFDFKLSRTSKALDEFSLKKLFSEIDLVFPVIHGSFGEDGSLQKKLEEYDVPFVGSSSASCSKMYFKDSCQEILKHAGFATLDFLVLQRGKEEKIREYVREKALERFIVKPVAGGSSVGVASFSDSQKAIEWAQSLFEKGYLKVLLEPFCKGREFTVVIMQQENGSPKALTPTEISISYDNHEIFDFRKKYLPTSATMYHTPPRFPTDVTNEIMHKAEAIFNLFEMRDFVRIDGWLMDDGTLLFTDINPINGLEQNSFFFIQASFSGMTHKEALQLIVKNACARYKLSMKNSLQEGQLNKKPVFVLFGGKNAERQVSLMSGTNVWLKLLNSQHFHAEPYFLDSTGDVWRAPYHCILNHTVEEVLQNCSALNEQKFSLNDFLAEAESKKAFVFIALHGGMGEDGTLQRILEERNILYNGSDAATSKLCMDKYETGKWIASYGHPDIASLPKIKLKEGYDWDRIVNELGSSELIIKPCSDGCSAGIVLLKSQMDFERYCAYVHTHTSTIPAGTFSNQKGLIEMPLDQFMEYIIEPYIETDEICIENDALLHRLKKGWVELTVGVLEEGGHCRALNPSITIAEGAVLSLEEKFQGGTGINITPPPEEILSAEKVIKVKNLIEHVAKALKIRNYARIDIFFNHLTEKMIVIEVNTLPALTPSTVIYHQALAEQPSLPPTAFLEKLILSKFHSS